MKKVFLSLITIFMVLSLSIVLVKAEGETTVELVDGVQIRTDGNNGLQWVANVTNHKDSNEYGFLFAQGDLAEVTVATPNVVKQVAEGVTEEKPVMKATMTRFPKAAAATDISVVAYAKDGENYTYSNVVVRNLAEVAVYAKNSVDGDFVNTVVQYVGANYMRNYVDSLGNLYFDNPVYETNPANLYVEFAKDWNKKFGANELDPNATGSTLTAGLKKYLQAGAKAFSTECDLYQFFYADATLKAKWSWLLQLLDGKPTTNEALSKQIDCLTGELTELDGDNFYYGLSVVSRLGGYFTQDFYSSGVGGCHFEQYPEFFAETIKYNDKVYSNLINAKLVKIGTNLPLQTIASKDGYSSNYTINKVDYNENNYEVSNVYVQFIPKYVPITYTVSYFEESNELNTLASTYTVESDTFALPTYEKDGYEFDGWYSTPTFEKGTKVTELPQGSFGNKVYYAKMVKVSADSSLINYVYCDYTFEQLRDEFISDWATYSDTGKRVFDLTNNAERKTTYAQWVATKAVLNNQTFVAKYKWLLTAVSNAIYEQNPWYKEQVKNYLTSGISAITEDTVYYHFVGELVGFWNQTKFLGIATYVTVPMTEWSDTITRNIAIETLISKSTVSQMTSVIGSELITPEKAGYTFVGWYTNAEYTGDAVTVTPAESCTLYAKWVKAA